MASLPPDKRLLSVRKQFVEKVSGSTLNQLLDSLLQRGIINEEEMDSARIKPKADRARDVIDVVRNKGAEASSSLIDDLQDLDPHLSETLHLKLAEAIEHLPHVSSFLHTDDTQVILLIHPNQERLVVIVPAGE
uniref:CARD domain-containing protein n=1 Tax=Amphilophus citrinellus TaxID=61819 RepID=A0A3Q0RYT7_AMPCI